MMDSIRIAAIVTLFILAKQVGFAQSEFVHPLDFRDTPEQRRVVLQYIVSSVEEQCMKLGIEDLATRRAVEEGELEAFKTLTQATSRQILDRVIAECHRLDIYDYATILAVYEGELEASRKSLEWE